MTVLISNLRISVGDKPIFNEFLIAVSADEAPVVMGPERAVCYVSGEGEPR